MFLFRLCIFTWVASLFYACGADDLGGLQRLNAGVSVPSQIDFGEVLLGAKKIQTLDILNSGEVGFQVTELVPDKNFETSDYVFAVELKDAWVGPNAQHSINVSFKPKTSAEVQAKTLVKFKTNAKTDDGKILEFSIAFTAKSLAHSFFVEPIKLDFNEVPADSTVKKEIKIINRLSSPINVWVELNQKGDLQFLDKEGIGNFEIGNAKKQDGLIWDIKADGTKNISLEGHAFRTVQVQYFPIGDGKIADQAKLKLFSCKDYESCAQILELNGKSSSARLSCVPSSLDFGATQIGFPVEANLECTNKTNRVMNVLGLSFDLSSDDFAVKNAPRIPFELSAEDSFSLRVEFNPKAMEPENLSREGRFYLQYALLGEESRVAQVELIGQVDQNINLRVVPNILDFGQVAFGTEKRLSVSIENNASSVVQLTDYIFDGSSAFEVISKPEKVDANTSVIFEIRYRSLKESNGELSEASLTIKTSDSRVPELKVALKGQGFESTGCVYEVDPSSVDFGQVPYKDEPLWERRIFINNIGTTPCVARDFNVSDHGTTFTSFTLDDDFEPSGSYKINPGDFLDFNILYIPTETGPLEAILSWNMSSPSQPEVQIPLRGEEVPLFLNCGGNYKTIVGNPIELTMDAHARAGLASVHWELLSRPSGETNPSRLEQTASGQTEISFTPNTVGRYQIRVSAQDGIGNNAQCTLEVMSLDRCNNRAVISPDPLALPDELNTFFESTLTLQNVYREGQTLTDTSKLIEICINAEHSWLRDLEISLICPNGKTVKMHEFTGRRGNKEYYLGIPDDTDAAQPNPGIGWEYCWAPNVQMPTWQQYVEQNPMSQGTLPPGVYASFEAFAQLNGCPLNGNWKLHIVDLWPVDNGFLFSWMLRFSPDLAPLSCN